MINTQTIHVIKMGKGHEASTYFVPKNLLPSISKDMQKVRESQSEASTKPIKNESKKNKPVSMNQFIDAKTN